MLIRIDILMHREGCISTFYIYKTELGTSLVVQGLELHASTVGGVGSIPGRGTKILQAVQRGPAPTKKKLKC